MRGIPRTDFAKRARSARRHTVERVNDDSRDMGVHPGLAKVLSLGGEEIDGPPAPAHECCFGCDCRKTADGGYR